MALITRQVTRTSQPRELVKVDCYTPISSGLRTAFTNSLQDVVTGSRFTWVAGSTLTVGASGQSRTYNGSSDYAYLDTKNASTLIAGGTILAVVQATAPGTDKRCFGVSSDTTTYFAIGSGATNPQKARIFISIAGNVGNTSIETQANVFDGEPHTIALCWTRGVGVQAYVDGLADASSANTYSTSTSNFPQLGAGALVRGSSAMGFYSGAVYLGALWNRPLSLSELSSVTANPWQIFEPITETIWLPDAAGSGAATATGSLSSVTIAPPSASGTGDAVTTAALAAAQLLAPTATASGSTAVNATATGDSAQITQAAPTATAAGAASATCPLASLLLNAAAAQSSGSALALGALTALQIIAPNGGATAGGAGSAVGGVALVSLTAPTTLASGSAIASGGLAYLGLTASVATASSGTSASASGGLSFIGLSSATASASGSASASASLAYLGLLASTGTATGAGLAYWPTPAQVLAGVVYGPTGADYTGALTGGSGPTAAEIAAAVRADLATELLQLTKISKIHGVGVPLVVSPTTRVAGDLAQTITTVGDTVTVSAV